MNRLCAASGCGLPAKGFSSLCPRHRSASARHGHHEQTGITVHELRPYRRKVEQRRKANPQSGAWRILEDRWARIVEHAEGLISAYGAGKALPRFDLQAARQVHTLAGSVSPAVIVETCLAMVLLWSDSPQRFRSDRAFDFQLARRVRGLTSVHAGTYWNHKTQRQSRTYRDVPPRTAEALARLLKPAFGAAGVQLALLEREGKDGAEQERKRLEDAIAALR